MTTLRDLLRDFQEESLEVQNADIDVSPAEQALAIKDGLQELLDELIDTIKERIIGSI